MKDKWKWKLEGVASPSEKNVSPGTMTAAAFRPGTVPSVGSAAMEFPLRKVKPDVVTTLLMPKTKEFKSCGRKVCASCNVKTCLRESYPVLLLSSSSGCRTVPLSNI